MLEEFFDVHLFGLINKLSGALVRYHSDFITIGQTLGGVLCLVLVAKEAYEMMMLKKSIDWLALFRPVAIALVLSNWIAVTTALKAPLESIEYSYSQPMFKKELSLVMDLNSARWQAATNRYQMLEEARAKAQAAEKEMSNGKESFFDKAWGSVKDAFAKVVHVVKTLNSIERVFFNTIIEGLVGIISNLVWAAGILSIFFAKEVGISLLIITGPITWALSLVPTWKDAWSTWIARYLSLCLYGIVAYFIMVASLQVFKYAIELDIKFLTEDTSMIPNPIAMKFTFLYSLLSAIVGYKGMMMVPELVTWIIPANSSHAMTKFASGVSSTIVTAPQKAFDNIQKSIKG